MVSGERGMNPVVMTIINPWKEFVQAGGRTSDLLIASPRRYGQSHRASTLIHFSGQGYQRSNPRSVLINHSQEHSMPFIPKILQLECNTTSDWLNRMVSNAAK